MSLERKMFWATVIAALADLPLIYTMAKINLQIAGVTIEPENIIAQQVAQMFRIYLVESVMLFVILVYLAYFQSKKLGSKSKNDGQDVIPAGMFDDRELLH